ncbi:MAG: hypothetical protein RSE98_03400, partial [Anaerovoracaceae bacterium]
MKKLFAILLSLAMLVCFMPTMAFAADATNEAQIEATATGYTTLQEAVDAAKSGQTVKLLKDVTSANDITLTVGTDGKQTGETITIDLNGFNISNTQAKKNPVSHPWGRVIQVQGGAHLTVIDSSTGNPGKITGSYAGFYVNGNITASDKFNETPINSTLVINSNITVSGVDYGIVYQGNGAKVVINAGNIYTSLPTGGSTAISGNGTVSRGGTTLEINGGTIGDSNDETALYQPQKGTTTITGGTFIGGTVLSIKDGTFNIRGGTFTANGEFKDPVENNDGTELTGAAVSITTNQRYVGPTLSDDISVNITGGTFKSKNGHAVYEGIAMNNSTPASSEAYVKQLTISGGTFTSASDKDSIKITNYDSTYLTNKGISGGTFSTNPTAYKAPGYVVVKNGENFVVTTPYIPPTPTTPEKPKEEVVTQPDGSTITTTTEKDKATGAEIKSEVVKDKDGKVTAKTEATAPVKSEVTGTTATATVGKDVADKLLEQTKEAEKKAAASGATKSESTITLDVKTAGTVAKAEVSLPADTLGKIANETSASVKVETSVGAIEFDQKALQEITKGQTTGNVKLVAEIINTDTMPQEVQDQLGENAMVVDLSVQTDAGKITDFNGGSATVSIAIPAGIDPTKLGAVYIRTDGKLERVEGKVVMVNGKPVFQFLTGHFSQYAILDQATIDKTIAAQNAKLVKGVKATKILAAKAVAKKGNATVTWKKSPGYKVDGYQIWKSSKKTTG